MMAIEQNPILTQPYQSRIFKALLRYQASPKPSLGGVQNKNPTKVVRVPLNFLEDLDVLIADFQAQSDEATESNPRFDRLRRFLSSLDELLPE